MEDEYKLNVEEIDFLIMRIKGDIDKISQVPIEVLENYVKDSNPMFEITENILKFGKFTEEEKSEKEKDLDMLMKHGVEQLKEIVQKDLNTLVSIHDKLNIMRINIISS